MFLGVFYFAGKRLKKIGFEIILHIFYTIKFHKNRKLSHLEHKKDLTLSVIIFENSIMRERNLNDELIIVGNIY
jgi:hypothetical protein